MPTVDSLLPIAEDILSYKRVRRIQLSNVCKSRIDYQRVFYAYVNNTVGDYKLLF